MFCSLLPTTLLLQVLLFTLEKHPQLEAAESPSAAPACSTPCIPIRYHNIVQFSPSFAKFVPRLISSSGGIYLCQRQSKAPRCRYPLSCFSQLALSRLLVPKSNTIAARGHLTIQRFTIYQLLVKPFPLPPYHYLPANLLF